MSITETGGLAVMTQPLSEKVNSATTMADQHLDVFVIPNSLRVNIV
jgi:hypothetical protein